MKHKRRVLLQSQWILQLFVWQFIISTCLISHTWTNIISVCTFWYGAITWSCYVSTKSNYKEYQERLCNAMFIVIYCVSLGFMFNSRFVLKKSSSLWKQNWYFWIKLSSKEKSLLLMTWASLAAAKQCCQVCRLPPGLGVFFKRFSGWENSLQVVLGQGYSIYTVVQTRFDQIYLNKHLNDSI